MKTQFASCSAIVVLSGLRLVGVAVALSLVPIPQAFCAVPQNGKVVWWGKDCFWTETHSAHTNGVIEIGGEVLTNAISIAANWGTGFAVRADGSVCSFGWDLGGRESIPQGLSNVASVTAERRTCWAIKRDGTVAQWGVGSVVAGLTDITAITLVGNEGFMALRRDGTLVGFRLSPSGPGPKPDQVRSVVVGGRTLSNVAAIARGPLNPKRHGTVRWLNGVSVSDASGPLILKTDGTVCRPEGMFLDDPCQYASETVVTVNGEPLSNIAAIASSELHALALRSNHTVVGWGDNSYGQTSVPADLTNAVAVAADHPLSLALRSDGTVAAWGANYDGQTSSIPKGLSNVVAIASGSMCGLALMTGNVPSTVYVKPHGRLEEMAALSDLVFKGKALSSERATNAAFRISSLEVFRTKFEVISALKGEGPRQTIEFLHYGGWGPGGHAWSGPAPPAYHRFDPGQSYLVFAANLDRPDTYYTPPPGAVSQPDVFRQVADIPRARGDDVLQTLDDRSLAGLSAKYAWMMHSIEEWRHSTLLVKEAHWLELNLLLTNSASSNLYALEKLDHMSLAGRSDDRWRHSDDFKRQAVLTALLPLTTNAEENIANRALACFGTEPSHLAQLEPFAKALIAVANHGSSPNRRLSAIGALSGTHFDAVSNSFAQLLTNKDEIARATAVGLLPAYPGPFQEQALRQAAEDVSPRVRAMVAEAIGQGRIASLLPTLKTLLSDPAGRTNPLPPLMIEALQGGGQVLGDNRGDVHTTAGYALLKFEVSQVGDLLKANLDDEGFRPSYLCKLAENDAGPWLTNLIEVLEIRRARVEKEVETRGVEPKAIYLQTRLALAGTYFNCWNIIYKYVHDLPAADFADGKMNRCLDALEKAGRTGSREATMLNELYKLKGLKRRTGE
jgi:hypothetical protein